ncbi:ComEA family DNA-binding protein [Pseudolysinimonas sp.]|uniref:ComEA family DNA-binding protein n=1 Tax=Pseudolysinimonas sp. TaxID=2680009 RepID=UPI002869FC01|nr:ComEA family DNA-binding protein [Pseudolysinimonas sp.]
MSATSGPDPRRARARRMAGVALTIVLVGLGIAVFATAVTPRGSTTVIAPDDNVTAAPVASAIYVHILGQVVRPGLYELPDGSRAVDAVAAAGGFTPQADAAGLNLARFVSDGEQIVVPAIGEAAAGAAPGVAGDGRVNLNTADAATLDTLPGVGPATAANILAWREENGRFESVEDLLDVGGIGEAKLDAIRDLVTV